MTLDVTTLSQALNVSITRIHRPCTIQQSGDMPPQSTNSQESGNSIRAQLLGATLRFARSVRGTPGIIRIALIGSLATDKKDPKDVDVLVTIADDLDLTSLARAGRQLQGFAQSLNRGADIFLANSSGVYLGRICHWRECHVRVACKALNCGHRDHLNDDLQVVRLEPQLITSPPIELWPKVRRNDNVPFDVESVLLTRLESASHRFE